MMCVLLFGAEMQTDRASDTQLFRYIWTVHCIERRRCAPCQATRLHSLQTDSTSTSVQIRWPINSAWTVLIWVRRGIHHVIACAGLFFCWFLVCHVRSGCWWAFHFTTFKLWRPTVCYV